MESVDVSVLLSVFGRCAAVPLCRRTTEWRTALFAFDAH